MKFIMYILCLVFSTTVFSQEVNVNSCEGKTKEACTVEKINQCVWDKTICTMNAKILKDPNMAVDPKDDLCAEFKDSTKCNAEMIPVCTYNRTEKKCLENKVNNTKGLFDPRRRK